MAISIEDDRETHAERFLDEVAETLVSVVARASSSSNAAPASASACAEIGP